MALDTNVLPGVVDSLTAALVTTKLVKGLEVGSPLGIPETPWLAVTVDGFESVQHEAEREPTEWAVLVGVYATYGSDQKNAEFVIASLVEPIRNVFRAHTKLGQVSIASSYVRAGKWGFVNLNGIDYRYAELTISVREKVSVTVSA